MTTGLRKASPPTFRQWMVLGAGSLVIVLVALSVHLLMLEVLKTPYPYPGDRLIHVRILYPLSQTLGLILLYAFAQRPLSRFTVITRWLILTALFSAMTGLFRDSLMAGVTTTDYVQPFATLAVELCDNLIMAGLVVLAAQWTRHLIARLVSTVLITGVMQFAVMSLVARLLTPLTHWAEPFARPELYKMPYGAKVLIPSYLAFLETVVSCLTVAFLITPRRSVSPRSEWISFAGVVLLVRGILVAMFIFGPMIGASPIAGLYSVSQFFLQDLVMVTMLFALRRFVDSFD